MAATVEQHPQFLPDFMDDGTADLFCSDDGSMNMDEYLQPLQFSADDSVFYDDAIGSIFEQQAYVQDTGIKPEPAAEPDLQLQELAPGRDFDNQLQQHNVAASANEISAVLSKVQKQQAMRDQAAAAAAFLEAAAATEAVAVSRKRARSSSSEHTSDLHHTTDEDDGSEAEAFAPANEEGVPAELLQKRARNRLHAKQSRTRKRAVMELLEEKLLRLRSENLGLRQLVLSCMPDRAEEVLKKCCDVGVPKTPVPAILHSGRGIAGTKKPAPVAKRPRSSARARGDGKDSKDGMPNALTLMEQDFKMIASLRSSQQNFVLTDPTRPNNPIVYASAGFLAHTGHASGAVLGKSLDLLTGPATDGNSLDILNTNLAAGRETSLCLLCYRADATPFWGQLYVSALCDRAGNVTAHVACLSEVAQLPLDEFRRRLRRVPLPRDLLAQDAAAAAAAVDAAVDAAAAAADDAARGGTGGIAAAVRSAHGHYGSGAPASADALSRITLPPAYGPSSSAVSGRRGSGSSSGSSPGAAALKVVDPLRRTRSAKRSSSP